MARGRPRPRGWYVKDGDPAGTERFWDGDKWGPQPRQMKNPPAAKGGRARRGGKKPATASGRKDARKDAQDAPTAEAEEAAPLVHGTIWMRITARSIDALILMLPWYFLVSEAFPVESDTITTRNDVYLWLTAVLVIGYEAIFTGIWGWTPGKRLMKLVVVDATNGQSRLGWAKAIMRATPLLLVVTLLLIPVLWVACVVAMYFDKQQRSVFDFTSGTAVVAAGSR